MIAQVEEDFSIVANNCGYTTVVISPVDNYKLQKKIAVFVDSVSCDYDVCAKATDPVVFVEDPIEKTLNVHNDADVASYPIGPNATAMVDLRDGMLKFDITDFAWEGLAIPMKIHHLYTSALRYTNFSNNNVYGIKLKDSDEMRMGYGWRLNYMPSLYKLGADDIYTFVDIEGNVYRLYSTEDKRIYKDKVDAGVIYNIEKSYIEIGKYRYYNRDNTWYVYDTSTGENEEEQAKIIVTTDNRIEYVKDESGCLFEVVYCNSKLNYIKAPNGNRVECEYDGEFLKTITYPSGEHLYFEYDNNHRIITASLKSPANVCEYMLSFLYDANDKISKVIEYGRDFAEGMSVDYSYDDNVTKLTTVSNEDTGEETTAISTYLFDFAGKLIDHYTNHYRCLKSNCKNNNYSYYLPSSNGPTISYERIPSNLLLGHGFDCEDAMNYWTVPEKCQSTQICYNMEDVVHGKGYLKIKAENNTSVYGCEISQSIIRIPAGEYTFSAYVKKKSGQANSGIRLRIKAVDGSGAESVRITDIGMGYVHLFTTFENKAEQKVTVSINVFGDGDFCVDSAQLEVGSSVSDYNVLENGNFMHYVHGWDRVRKNVGYVVYNDIMYSLNGRMTIRKKNTGENMPCQIVQVKSYEDTRTTYTLSGFAKLKATALTHSDTLKFRLCANIIYVEEQPRATEGPHCEQYIANFSQATTEWQYTSVTFTKSLFRAIDHIEVVCEYYDSNTENTVVEYAYFDSVSLTIGETEYNLTEEDFSICNAEAGYKIKTLKENFSKHGNGFSCTSSEKALETIGFLKKFNENHMDIEKILWEGENVGNVSCSYDEFNNLIAVVCGEGRTYSYEYNQFHKLDRITLSGMKKPLVKYEYKNCNGSLKSATYANGRYVEYTYDRFNRPVRAVWYDANGNIKNDIRHTYNSEDKLVSILDTINRTERICLYEHGKLAYEMYSDGAFVDSNGFKTSGVLSYISFHNVDKI